MLRAEIFPCATGSPAPDVGPQPFHQPVPFLASVCRNCHFRYSVRENYCPAVCDHISTRSELFAINWLHAANCSKSIVRAPRGSPIVNSKVSPAFARGHFSLHVSLHILSHFILLLLVVQRAWCRFLFALCELPCVSSLVPSEAASRSGSFAPDLLS